MFSNGQRGGPLATYLATAKARSNFDLWMNTAVRRAIRSGSKVSGVELECLTDGGFSGNVQLNPKGAVIFSAGTFGSAKLLMRSKPPASLFSLGSTRDTDNWVPGGIGPQDQLQVVAGSKDGPTFSPTSDWINLPVGYNLIDHLNTDLIVTHPDVVFYDFYAAWTNPIPADQESYLKSRTGILTQAAPNIGPMVRSANHSRVVDHFANRTCRCGMKSRRPMALCASSSGLRVWKALLSTPTRAVSRPTTTTLVIWLLDA